MTIPVELIIWLGGANALLLSIVAHQLIDIRKGISDMDRQRAVDGVKFENLSERVDKFEQHNQHHYRSASI